MIPKAMQMVPEEAFTRCAVLFSSDEVHAVSTTAYIDDTQAISMDKNHCKL